MNNLKNLYIDRNNKNSNISSIILPSTLKEFDCSTCNIKDFKFLEKMNNLKVLSINGNGNSNISSVILPRTLKEYTCSICNIDNNISSVKLPSSIIKYICQN
ncbi:leucine rich repeat gene family [Choristoneura biennis entomopoxvirus]|uniref:Leucine rich repeat gene family n=1 Tax=Choristoneura biennis entomopoxvirus TaxID=10288 RepID=A0A916KPT3_CBEPV|nr:leucine rich repeat gene family [Choristoneura biennis entomopoxvirus]CCU55600.1 leucine rich repeat gene family [Choristoneura biennis entomopoxvirus]